MLETKDQVLGLALGARNEKKPCFRSVSEEFEDSESESEIESSRWTRTREVQNLSSSRDLRWANLEGFFPDTQSIAYVHHLLSFTPQLTYRADIP